ncbi:MAG: hypothetical protein ACM3NQ_10550 [Bacteroidales bacterium]
MNVRLIATVWLTGLLAACGGSVTPTSPAATPPSTTRIIALTGNLAFGNVEVGGLKSAALTIANNGNAALTITAFDLNLADGAESKGVFTAFFSDTYLASGTIPAGASRTAAVLFNAGRVGSFTGTLTVKGDQTAGTNTIDVSGTGTFSAGPMFTVSSTGGTVKAGAYSPLAGMVFVTPNGANTNGMIATADVRGFGYPQPKGLTRCYGCGELVFELDLTVPSDMPAGTMPVTFTVTDAGGRTATTTTNLTVAR